MPIYTDVTAPTPAEVSTGQDVANVVNKAETDITQRVKRAADITALRSIEPDFDGQQIELLGHTNKGVGGGMFYYDSTNSDSDDNGVTIVTSGGARWLRMSNKVELVDFGADPTGTYDSAAAINSAHNAGKPVIDSLVGTYLIGSTVRFKSSFEGSTTGTNKTTTFKKVASSGALIVHYPQLMVYSTYTIDANGEQTAFDVFSNSQSTFSGGMKYAYCYNIKCQNMTARAFNLNGPLFGTTLINMRVAANNADGSADSVIAFYTTIEDQEGIGTPTGDANASFTLITPNVYNATDRANNVVFLQADYCRGVSVISAEVACAKILQATQSDIQLQGAFEYINTHSQLYNSVVTIGAGTNIQVFRESPTDWIGHTSVPYGGSDGRHVFRLDADSGIIVDNISFFNQLGDHTGVSGDVGLIACASGFTGTASAKNITEYSTAGGGFSQPIQVASESGAKAQSTTIEKPKDVAVSRSLSNGNGILPLFKQSGSTKIKGVDGQSVTYIRSLSVECSGTESIDVAVRVATYNSDGSTYQSARSVLTIPASSTDYEGISLDTNRQIPVGGYAIVSVSPSGGSFVDGLDVFCDVTLNG